MKIFVVMSFDSEFEALYNFIKNIFKNEGHSVFRADDLLNQQNILKDIVVSINESDLILADLTGANANVFYELGLAHPLRKNVILLTQDISELPFDLRSYRVIEYSTHFSQVELLKTKLVKIISDIGNGTLLFSNPVTDWIDIKQATAELNLQTEIVKADILNSSEDDTDLGFLDFTADIEETMGELTEIITGIGQKTEEIGLRATEDTLKIQEAWKNASQGTSSYVRKIARKTAESMNNYGTYIKSYNQKYEEIWSKYENSIIRLLESKMPINTKEDLEAFINYINIQPNLKDSIIESRKGFSSMLESFIALNGIQKDISRSAHLIEIEIKKFIGLLDKSIASIERVIELGEVKIKELQKVIKE